MGVKQSKRSVDITEISTKGEIEGFGNEGKVEKILEGVEKVAANGHLDGDLVNAGESQQNGIEAAQNGEAAGVASAKVVETKDVDESGAGVVNGTVENGEINGEAEKIDEEPKKSEEKKEKKKDKKDKADKSVKKRFSLRNFSFTKKDKSKPSKEEKSPENTTEGQTAEESTSSPVQEQEETVNTPEESTEAKVSSPVKVEAAKIVEEKIPEEVEKVSVEKITEAIQKPALSSDDLPPPLPASPPPSEVLVSEKDSSFISVEKTISTVNEITSAVTNILNEKIESSEEVIKSAEEIVIETGKQIEEKATNLLKTVEERAGESIKAVQDFIPQKTGEVIEACQIQIAEQSFPELVPQEPQADEAAGKVTENVVTAPVEISNVDSLATNTEDSLEKREEGGGESLADIPQDLPDVSEATEPTETDSLDMAAIPPPPPTVEPLTGE